MEQQLTVQPQGPQTLLDRMLSVALTMDNQRYQACLNYIISLEEKIATLTGGSERLAEELKKRAMTATWLAQVVENVNNHVCHIMLIEDSKTLCGAEIRRESSVLTWQANFERPANCGACVKLCRDFMFTLRVCVDGLPPQREQSEVIKEYDKDQQPKYSEGHRFDIGRQGDQSIDNKVGHASDGKNNNETDEYLYAHSY